MVLAVLRCAGEAPSVTAKPTNRNHLAAVTHRNILTVVCSYFHPPRSHPDAVTSSRVCRFANMDTIEDRHCCWAFLEPSQFCIPPAQADAGVYPPWPTPQQEAEGGAKFTSFSSAVSHCITKHFARSPEPLRLTLPAASADAPPLRVTVQRLPASLVGGGRHWLGLQRIEGRSVRWIRLYVHAVPLPRPRSDPAEPSSLTPPTDSTGDAPAEQRAPPPSQQRKRRRARTTEEPESGGGKCAKREVPRPRDAVGEDDEVMLSEEPEQPAPSGSAAAACTFCLEDIGESDFTTCGQAEAAPVTRTRFRPTVCAIRLPACGHAFHTACIERWFHDCHLSCPTCRCSIDAPPRQADAAVAHTSEATAAFRKWTSQFVDLGAQPDGMMQISLEPRALPGHPHRCTFTLYFYFPTFFADPAHYRDPELAGKCIRGTRRTYFLPASETGFERLEGLVHAFRRRKAFGVGESLLHPELGLTVKHATIPWKSTRTATSANPFGYPDDDYLTRLKIALDDVLLVGTSPASASAMQLQGAAE
jgi:hypothetical protein